MIRLINTLIKGVIKTLIVILGASLLMVYPIQSIIATVFILSVIGAYHETL